MSIYTVLRMNKKQNQSNCLHVLLPQPEYIALLFSLPGFSTSSNWHVKFLNTHNLQTSSMLSHKFHCCSAEHLAPEIVIGSGNLSISLMLTHFINTLNLVSSTLSSSIQVTNPGSIGNLMVLKKFLQWL